MIVPSRTDQTAVSPRQPFRVLPSNSEVNPAGTGACLSADWAVSGADEPRASPARAVASRGRFQSIIPGHVDVSVCCGGEWAGVDQRGGTASILMSSGVFAGVGAGPGTETKRLRSGKRVSGLITMSLN